MNAEEVAANSAVVWITGAGRGIGRSVAAHLAARGHRIYLTDVDAAAAQRAADDLRAAGCRAQGFGCDVTAEDDVNQAMTRITADARRLDVLLNCAGIVRVDDLLQMNFADWKQVMTVNLDGTVLAGLAAARQMVAQDVHDGFKRRGMVVNIGSPVVEWGRPRFAAYGASKAAVKHWTMSLAAAMTSESVVSTLLYPGMVIDGLYQDIVSKEAELDNRSSEELAAERASQSPNGRYQRPDEVGPFVEHLIERPGMGAAGQVVWTAPIMRNIT